MLISVFGFLLVTCQMNMFWDQKVKCSLKLIYLYMQKIIKPLFANCKKMSMTFQQLS